MNGSKIKKSASLIILSAFENNKNNKNLFNYKVMLLKRNNRMRVAPSHHVYPGGKYDELIDKSSKWLKIFFNTSQLKQIEQNQNLLHKNFFNCLINQNTISSLSTNKTDNECNYSNLPLEVSFRLCAIRETFEETGLLLAFDKNAVNSCEIEKSKAKLFSDYYKNNLSNWHKIVKNDSSQFLNMFFDLNLVPDIFGLHEWANWITPTHEKYRFDTYFFTCFLPSLPSENSIHINTDEIESLEFYTPEEALDMHKKKEIKFIPPQLYEFNRLKRFKNIQALSEYSLARQYYGLKPWLPKFVQNGQIGLLPGDFLYDLITDDEINDSDKFNSMNKQFSHHADLKLNRIIKYKDNKANTVNYDIICNYDFDGIK